MLVPIRRNAADLDNIYALNQTAALIWGILDGKTSLGNALERIVEEFDVEAQDAEKDLIGLISTTRIAWCGNKGIDRWNAHKPTHLVRRAFSIA